MGVLRQLEESRGHLVHDGDLRQPCEDERLLVPHPQAGEAAPMSEYAVDFGDFDGRIWLNAAHQGPLPRVAIAAAEQALAAKAAPHRIADDDFSTVPRRLRELLGRVVGHPRMRSFAATA